jgi:hypothetical protein
MTDWWKRFVDIAMERHSKDDKELRRTIERGFKDVSKWLALIVRAILAQSDPADAQRIRDEIAKLKNSRDTLEDAIDKQGNETISKEK